MRMNGVGEERAGDTDYKSDGVGRNEINGDRN